MTTLSNPILEVDKLDIRYGSVLAVRGLDLKIHRGDAVGLIGANGAGKTTTLQAIMGVVPVHSGEIRFEGTSLMGIPTETIARTGIALVPEGRRIFGDFTVEENLRLGMFGAGKSGKSDDDLAWVRSLFPIVAEFSDRRAGQLSGGQQQQLAIARALISKPKLLLLDEPSLGLAPTIVDDLFGALDEVRKNGVTILIVEQRAQMAVEFADRTVVMRNGEIVLSLEGDESIGSDQMAAAYFGS